MRDKIREPSLRSQAVPWSGVRTMFNLAQRYEDVVNLSVGEPDFDTPKHILDAAVDAMKTGYTHYTPNAGLMDLREAIAEKLGKENADPSTELHIPKGCDSRLTGTPGLCKGDGERIRGKKNLNL